MIVNASSVSINKEKQVSPFVWAAIGIFFLACGLGGLLGAGNIIRLIFPFGAFVIGLFLYGKHPTTYISYLWWMWFISPILTRLVDYGSGWDPSRLMLVAPYLVTFITCLTLFKYLPTLSKQGGTPFILIFMVTFYGLLVGLIQSPPISVIRSALDWLSPLLLGFHLLAQWQDYPLYRKSLQSTFLWGTLVMGAYGIVQYLIAPEWDRFWLIESGMYTSAGDPVPMGMRIWSTMHSQGPFANTIAAGLILLLATSSYIRIPAIIVGSLSFLLTLVRSSWGAFFIAILIFLASLRSYLQIRLFTTLLLLSICVIPLALLEPFSANIGDRMQTIINIEDDNSFNARTENYEDQLQLALSTFLGRGIGNTFTVNPETGELEKVVLDSGFLDFFFTLGWLGAIFYIGSLATIIFKVLSYSETSFDPFMSASRSLGLAYCTQLIFGSAMIGVTGLLLWGFLGITMAGHNYYQQENLLKTTSVTRSIGR